MLVSLFLSLLCLPQSLPLYSRRSHFYLSHFFSSISKTKTVNELSLISLPTFPSPLPQENNKNSKLFFSTHSFYFLLTFSVRDQEKRCLNFLSRAPPRKLASLVFFSLMRSIVVSSCSHTLSTFLTSSSSHLIFSNSSLFSPLSSSLPLFSYLLCSPLSLQVLSKIILLPNCPNLRWVSLLLLTKLFWRD